MALLCGWGSWWLGSLEILIRIKALIAIRRAQIRVVQIKDLPWDVFSWPTTITHNIELSIAQSIVPRWQIKLLMDDLPLLGYRLLVQSCMHTPGLLPLRSIARAVIQEPLMLYDLAWVIVYSGLIDFLTSQLSWDCFFPLLVSLGPWELEGRSVMIVDIGATSLTYETLVDCMRELAITTRSLLL